MVWTLLQIALGGALGSVLRFASVTAAGRVLGADFPYGTMIVNIAGSLLIGVLAVLLLARAHPAGPFLITGVLGGFTTFSAFSLDALRLIEGGQPVQAAFYVAGSVLLSLVAVALGAALARGVFA